MWRDLAPVGRSSGSGGYFRQPWTPPSASCGRGSPSRPPRAGWSWRPTASATPSPGGAPRAPPAGTCSPARTSTRVLDGGAYDGPLGVVSALAALDLLRERGLAPTRPVGVAVFVEEEGSRFGLACLGSRLATGATTWARARELRDRDGVPLEDALARADLGVAGDDATWPALVDAHASSSCTSSRAATWSTGERRRRGQRDLAARALPLRLRRRGQPCRDHPDGGPPRPDADLRDDRAGGQQAGPAGRPAGDLRPGRGRRPTAPTRCRRG